MIHTAARFAPPIALAAALGACSGTADAPTTEVSGSTAPATPPSEQSPSPVGVAAASPNSTTTPAAAAVSRATVPERFRGLYALDRQACAEDYTYDKAFQNVRVKADSVSFFETGGPVTDVDADGDAVAIMLREQVGDGEHSWVVYLRLTGDGTARYRAGAGAPVEEMVRCPA